MDKDTQANQSGGNRQHQRQVVRENVPDIGSECGKNRSYAGGRHIFINSLIIMPCCWRANKRVNYKHYSTQKKSGVVDNSSAPDPFFDIHNQDTKTNQTSGQ